MWGGLFFVAVFLALFILYVFFKTAVVVPQQSAYVVERLGALPRRRSTPASTSCCRSSTRSATATR